MSDSLVGSLNILISRTKRRKEEVDPGVSRRDCSALHFSSVRVQPGSGKFLL